MTFNQFKSIKLKEHYLEYLDSIEDRWTVDSNNYYIDTHFGSTFVREIGEGKPIVLLPGKSSSSLQYASIIEGLSRNNKVFVIDIIGDFGRSILNVEVTSPYDYALWQKDVYTALGIKNFTIAGISMGAWIGALYTSRYNDVKNLIMISPVSTVAPLSGKTTVWGILSILLPFTGRFLMKKYFVDLFKRKAKAKVFFENEIWEPIKIINKCFRPVPPQIPKRLSQEEIQNIEAKVFYLVGENEVVYNYDDGIDYFMTQFKGGKFEVFKNSGHDLFAIEPESVLERIKNFIKQ